MSVMDVSSMVVEAEHSRLYSITCCCCVTAGSRGIVWQNGRWHGSVDETKACHWIPTCRKNGTHWHSSTLAERWWRPNSGCEHSEGWVVRFSSGDSDVKRQATFQVTIYSWHSTKWRAFLSAHQCKSVDCDQGTLCRAEYQLQCVGNDCGIVGISQILHQVDPQVAHRKKHCMQVWQNLLNQYKAEGDSFSDHIIHGDKIWCHRYEFVE